MTNAKLVSSTREAYNATASDYAKEHNDAFIMSLQRHEYTELLGLGRILDAGCGTGRDAKYFSEYKGPYEVIGIDNSRGMLEIAKKNAPKASFIEMDLRDMSLDAESFDGIWCCSSIHHLDRKDAFGVLVSFKNLLRDGGLLYVTVKEGHGHQVLGDEGKRRLFYFYRMAQLKSMVTKAGFEVVKSYKDYTEANTKWLNVFGIAGKSERL